MSPVTSESEDSAAANRSRPEEKSSDEDDVHDLRGEEGVKEPRANSAKPEGQS